MRFKILFLSVLFLCGNTIIAQKIDFKENPSFEEVVLKAQKEKKPFFIDFYTSWCGYCKKMDQTTFSDPDVKKYVEKRFVPVKMDAEKSEGRSIAQKHGVRGYPTIIVFSPDGKFLGKIVGYVDSENLIAKLQPYEDEQGSGLSPELAGTHYMEVKKEMLDDLKALALKKWSSDDIAMLEKAYGFGGDRNNFEYEELKFELSEMKKTDISPIMLELEYLLGQNQYEDATMTLKKAFKNEVLTDDQIHYFLVRIFTQGYYNIEMLKIINQLELENEEYAYLDTKAALQYLNDDLKDAKGTAKEAIKKAKKSKKDSSASQVLLSVLERN